MQIISYCVQIRDGNNNKKEERTLCIYTASNIHYNITQYHLNEVSLNQMDQVHKVDKPFLFDLMKMALKLNGKRIFHCEI